MLAPVCSPARAQTTATRPQTESQTSRDAADSAQSAASPQAAPEPGRSVSARDRRQAARLFLNASRLFEKAQFDAAMDLYEQAARLDPSKPDYPMAARVARSHAVTAFIQSAARARLTGDVASARAALERALQLDPANPQVAEHIRGLADEAVADRPEPIYAQGTSDLADVPVLAPAAGVRSFHLREDSYQIIQAVYRAFGIQASIDSSVDTRPARLDIDHADFAQAQRALNLITGTFSVPLDAHRAFVIRDTSQNRTEYTRQEMETFYLPGMPEKDRTEVVNLAKNVFDARQVALEPSSGTLTIRAPAETLDAFNTTLRQLFNGRSQVLLNVRLIQLGHTRQRNTGLLPPQQMTAFNVYAEEQAILNANQELVQQIISSGLAAPGDTLAILGILLASGQVSSSIFSNGIALFGGGLTLSGLSPGPATANLSINSSISRELDDIQLRLGDGDEGTLRSGLRYPITTSSYSNLGANTLNIPGLTSAGTSSSLSSLVASLAGASVEIPQVQYQDLGLTLKATPKVLRNGDVALSLDLKMTALSGGSLNGLP
ncbi:MAG TPA: hypothetical protein VFI20_12520, partial [Terracidiphilus sp.]|nr:hypothetical protein [Terracidiphilus sp.]